MIVISVKQGLLCLKEVTHTPTQTLKNYWYYDLTNNLVSSHGQKNDKPCRPMTAGARSWVLRHFVPKLTDKDRQALGLSEEDNILCELEQIS